MALKQCSCGFITSDHSAVYCARCKTFTSEVYTKTTQTTDTTTLTRKFQVKFNGLATNVYAKDAADAWQRLRDFLDHYVHTKDIKEVGVEIDENGWPLEGK